MERVFNAPRRGGRDTWVGSMRDWIMVKEAWLMAIAVDPSLPPRASAVGIVLASHFNHRDGRAFLGFERLVGLVGGAQERTVQRSLAAMQKARLLDRDGGFPGCTRATGSRRVRSRMEGKGVTADGMGVT